MPQTTLISKSQIEQRVAEMGRQITADFSGHELVVCCVLKGAMFFCSDLMRHIACDAALDFIQVSSYGTEKYSSGVVTILKEPQLDMHGKAVLIVEDIIDSGLTLDYLRSQLVRRNPASLRVCALLNKPERRIADVPVDYLGFDIPNEFVVGYGLDYGERYRNLPYIGILKHEIYQQPY